MAARAAAADLAKISNLGLGKNTLAQISAFRKRADDAKRQLAQLQQQKTDVDFAHYNKLIRNKDVVSQAQKILAEFKPVTYDVQAQLKAIDAFESKAVRICPPFRHLLFSPRTHRRIVASASHRIASHRIHQTFHRIASSDTSVHPLDFASARPRRKLPDAHPPRLVCSLHTVALGISAPPLLCCANTLALLHTEERALSSDPERTS